MGVDEKAEREGAAIERLGELICEPKPGQSMGKLYDPDNEMSPGRNQRTDGLRMALRHTPPQSPPKPQEPPAGPAYLEGHRSPQRARTGI